MATIPPDVAAARQATIMFVLVALAMSAVLVMAVAILIARRARRRQERPPNQPIPRVDPWSESGRRIQPYDRGEHSD